MIEYRIYECGIHRCGARLELSLHKNNCFKKYITRWPSIWKWGEMDSCMKITYIDVINNIL
jgi:hypothetical protein